MTKGVFRRRIRITTPEPGVAAAELEDDFHHFRVRLAHRDGRVIGAAGEGMRHPWTSCGSAGDRLAELVGVPLSSAPDALGAHAEVRTHCTHLFDLAALALAHAAAGRSERVYDIAVPDREQWRTVATLRRDGDPLLEWVLQGTEIAAPDPYTGRPLRGGFIAWAVGALDEETAEAALVLRRACDISIGRMQDLDIYDDPTPLMSFMDGTCFTFRAGTAETSRRVKGSMRDFTDTPDQLLAPPR